MGTMAKNRPWAPSPEQKQRDEENRNRKIAEDAANAYARDKGYSESSLEAVRRAARANRRPARVRIGQHEADI